MGMKLKSNQSGIANLAAIALVIVFLGFIGGIGYLVYSSQYTNSEEKVNDRFQKAATEIDYSLLDETTKFGAKTNASIKVPKD